MTSHLSVEARVGLLEDAMRGAHREVRKHEASDALHALSNEAYRYKVRDRAVLSARDAYAHIVISILPVEAVGAFQGGHAILQRKEAERLHRVLTEALSRPGPKVAERD